jgi:hypothetical protein
MAVQFHGFGALTSHRFGGLSQCRGLFKLAEFKASSGLKNRRTLHVAELEGAKKRGAQLEQTRRHFCDLEMIVPYS